MAEAYDATEVEDESLAYSSYTFGDAPTTIPRSYLGDPAKFRLVHGGGEVFHSHHPHGGTIRWTRSPQREKQQLLNLTTAAYDGPVKYPVVRTTSDRVDRGNFQHLSQDTPKGRFFIKEANNITRHYRCKI